MFRGGRRGYPSDIPRSTRDECAELFAPLGGYSRVRAYHTAPRVLVSHKPDLFLGAPQGHVLILISRSGPFCVILRLTDSIYSLMLCMYFYFSRRFATRSLFHLKCDSYHAQMVQAMWLNTRQVNIYGVIQARLQAHLTGSYLTSAFVPFEKSEAPV